MAATEKLLKASGVLYTDRRNFYVAPQVVKELWTDVAPFTTVVSNREQRKVPDPIFKMFEHRNPWHKQYFLNNGDTDNLDSDNETDTTVTVDGASNCNIDDSLVGAICEVWTTSYGTKKGIVRVDSVTSSTVIVVNTLWTSTGSDIALVDNDIFEIIGNAQGEGTDSPEAWADELSVVWNSCQIFKTPYRSLEHCLLHHCVANLLSLHVYVPRRLKSIKCRRKKRSYSDIELVEQVLNFKAVTPVLKHLLMAE